MKLPEIVLVELENTLEGLHFGRVNLEIMIHDQKPKFRIITERSVVPGSETSGNAQAARP
jgi:hypothetical protein